MSITPNACRVCGIALPLPRALELGVTVARFNFHVSNVIDAAWASNVCRKTLHLMWLVVN